MKLPILVIDLEATCWGKGDPTAGVNEIIEIGVALIASKETIAWKKGWFVKPRIATSLTEFCTKLTSISWQDLEDKPYLPEVLKEIEEFLYQQNGITINQATFASWGSYDRKQFVNDCALHQIPYPFGEHKNIKSIFMKQNKLKRSGLKEALSLLNLEFEGTHHRGVDDAYNIARLVLHSLSDMIEK